LADDPGGAAATALAATLDVEGLAGAVRSAAEQAQGQVTIAELQ
jgi:hypothetical protein